MQRSVPESIFTADGSAYFIFSQNIYITAHVQQGFYSGCIQFIQLFNKADHLLKIIFNFFFFLCIELEPRQVSKFINEIIIYIHPANIKIAIDNCRLHIAWRQIA